jgi:predicted amidophosphoribosyltransferase
MGISFFGIIVVGVAAVTLLYVAAKGVSVTLSLIKSMQSGHVTLACPHCGQKTTHGRGVCDVCGHDL